MAYEALEEVPDDVELNHALLDRVVVCKLNGGLGTTMGCRGPKSCLEVDDDRTFLDLTVRQVETINIRYGVDVPLLLMVSFSLFYILCSLCYTSSSYLFSDSFLPLFLFFLFVLSKKNSFNTHDETRAYIRKYSGASVFDPLPLSSLFHSLSLNSLNSLNYLSTLIQTYSYSLSTLNNCHIYLFRVLHSHFVSPTSLFSFF